MARPGHNPSLDELVREHLPAAVRFAMRLTGNPHDAEDVVQDALLRVAKSGSQFRGQAQFRTWLFRIVINAFRDSISKNQAIPIQETESRQPGPFQDLQTQELGRLIAQRISQLPPRQREVLVLITYENMNPQDVSQMLGISDANVYQTLSAARERLRRELAPYLVEK